MPAWGWDRRKLASGSAADPGQQLGSKKSETTLIAMSKSDEKAAREQRLATKLRENLKRRKGQAKARSGAASAAGEKAAPGQSGGGSGGSKAS